MSRAIQCTWLLLVCGCSALVTRPVERSPLGRRAALAHAAALIPIVAAPTVALAYNEFVGVDASVAKQLADSTAPPENFNGRYSVASGAHPGCARKVSKSGKFVTISGADEDGKKWTVQGRTDGRDLRIDFSSRGGPPDLLGRADSIQIKFANGDVWKKQL
jgi:hypothetical protein